MKIFSYKKKKKKHLRRNGQKKNEGEGKHSDGYNDLKKQ